MRPQRTLAQVLADTGPILLDFDGPVCDAFASKPAHAIADQLRQVLGQHGAAIPAVAAKETDPFEVLRCVAALNDPTLTAQVDDTLRAAEHRAIERARPTPYAREVIVAAHNAGRPLAIVSNNAAAAIHAYLVAHRLTRYIADVIGRPHADPGRMKPDPGPVVVAVRALGAKPGSCALLGDSVNDIKAALAVGVHTIGYANKPGKLERLAAAGADTVAVGTEGMAELARLLHAEADVL